MGWRQVERVRDERSWEHDVILDGVRVSPGRRADDAGWDARFSEPIRTDGDEHRVRIVQRGTGLASEWAFPAKRFPRIEQSHLRFVLQIRRDDDDTIVIEFQNDPTPDKRDRRIAKFLFRRGPDRLYRFAGPAGRDGSAARTAGR